MVVDGVIEAYDEYEAVQQIKATCPIVLSVREVKSKDQKDLFPPKLKLKSLALVCSQFSIILSAGLPTVRAVQLVADQTADPALKKILLQVATDVAAGHSLASSFENKGRGLPTTLIETVRAGEETGTLDVSFQKLFRYFDKASKTHEKVKSALVYPTFLCVIAVIVVAVLMIKVIPVFVTMFESMNLELPIFTRIIIAVSNFMVHYWLLLLAALIALVLGLKIWAQTNTGRHFFANLRLHFFFTRQLENMNGAAQFANTMTTILSSGMPITRALGITSRVLDNIIFADQTQQMISAVEAGRRLGDAMLQTTFPKLLCEMAGVGEESGSIENTLEVIGSYYDNEVRVATERMLTMLEPMITVGMAVIVVIILLGFYLPMFSMYGAMA